MAVSDLFGGMDVKYGGRPSRGAKKRVKRPAKKNKKTKAVDILKYKNDYEAGY